MTLSPATAAPWEFDPRPRAPEALGFRRSAGPNARRSSSPAVAGSSLRFGPPRPQGSRAAFPADAWIRCRNWPAPAPPAFQPHPSRETAAPRTPRTTQHITGHPERAPCTRIVARRLPAIGPGRPPRRAPFLVRLQSPRAPPVPLDQFCRKLLNLPSTRRFSRPGGPLRAKPRVHENHPDAPDARIDRGSRDPQEAACLGRGMRHQHDSEPAVAVL
jgi:hypothetical protein